MYLNRALKKSTKKQEKIKEGKEESFSKEKDEKKNEKNEKKESTQPGETIGNTQNEGEENENGGRKYEIAMSDRSTKEEFSDFEDEFTAKFNNLNSDILKELQGPYTVHYEKKIAENSKLKYSGGFLGTTGP